VTTGPEGLVRQRGFARTALEPRGTIFVHGEIWQAVADTPVRPEAEVEILAVEGLKLRVRPVVTPSTEEEVS
jgi:membrane-bound serine protease (ClpP class)